MKKIYIFMAILLTLPTLSVSAADALPVLQPSLQLQMVRQEQVDRKNIFARRLALQASKRQAALGRKAALANKPATTGGFILIGASEAERQKYLLSHYATLDFQDWQLWLNTSLAGKIDPSFMMCVGLAESTLGNHLKTPYNIGNIGNTDSG
jgi:hypothetical protein